MGELFCRQVPLRPAYDAELAGALAVRGFVPMPFDADALEAMRTDIRGFSEEIREGYEARGYVVEDLTVPAADGYPIGLVHTHAAGARDLRPCVFYIHGGGMMVGTPWDGVTDFEGWIDDFGASVFSVDYRLAPEFTAPTLVEDCYTALCYVVEHAQALGINPEAIVVAGMSAGGGLAAGTALLAREHSGPPLAGQLLMAPMLDPDADGDSVRQEPLTGPWSAEENRRAWSMVLAGTDPGEVRFNTPGRVKDLAGLPPALLEVGSAETFRFEVIDYAARIWRAGGSAELHVWDGGYHGFENHFHTSVGRAALESRNSWLGRIFGYGPQDKVVG